MKKQSIAALTSVSLLTGACGLVTPEKNAFVADYINSNNTPSGGDYENALVAHIRCEIGRALRFAYNNGKTLKQNTLVPLEWIKKWGTAVTLTITVEDQSAFNPGVSWIQPFGAASLAQSRTLGLGANANANATRTETIQYTYLNSELLDSYKDIPADYPSTGSHCDTGQSGLMVDGDLKVWEFVYDKIYVAVEGNTSSGDAYWPPYNTFTDDVKFVVGYSGSVTPTLKLTRFTADNSGTFFSATRTNTDEVIITLGPIGSKPTRDKPATLGQAATDQHQARVIGNAITSGGP